MLSQGNVGRTFFAVNRLIIAATLAGSCLAFSSCVGWRELQSVDVLWEWSVCRLALKYIRTVAMPVTGSVLTEVYIYVHWLIILLFGVGVSQ